MNYNALHTSDTQGTRIDMTNWATMGIPKASLPHVDLGMLGAKDPLTVMFRRGFDKYTIIDLCHPHHPDIVGAQTERWKHAFTAIKAKTYFDRGTHKPAYGAAYLYYHPPIRGVLQSSYADVEYELDWMRSHANHKHSAFVFGGGDGLAVMRINHTLARKPHIYLQQRPAVIPVQGEHPHGTCHVLHMGWRPYWPLLTTILTGIGHTECKREWTVSSFNDYDFASCILTRGIAEYFIQLEASPGCPPLDRPGAFLTAIESNTDLEWLYHYLHDFGFLYWDMRQSVRNNASRQIDLIWRECVSFMHTSESNKTQYAPMAIQVYSFNHHVTLICCFCPASNTDV